MSLFQACALPSQSLRQSASTADAEKCSFCGDNPVERICSEPGCSRNRLCQGCSDLWHGHPNRRGHDVQPVDGGKNASYFGLQPYKGAGGIRHRAQESAAKVQRHKSYMPADCQSSTRTGAKQRTSGGDDVTLLVRAQNPVEAPAAIGGGVEWHCEHCTSINKATDDVGGQNKRLVCYVCGKSSDRTILSGSLALVSAPVSVPERLFPMQIPTDQAIVTRQPVSVDRSVVAQTNHSPGVAALFKESHGHSAKQQVSSRNDNGNYSGHQASGGQLVAYPNRVEKTQQLQQRPSDSGEVPGFNGALKQPQGPTHEVLVNPQSCEQRNNELSSQTIVPKSSVVPEPETVQATGSGPATLLPLKQETFQQICNLNISDAEKELLIRLLQEPNFSRFRLPDLVKAVESSGELAYDDEYMLAYLNSACKKCGKSEPRHHQLCMSQCSCQLCFDCFQKLVLACIDLAAVSEPNRFACPGCQLPQADNVEHFATHIKFLKLQVEYFGEAFNWVRVSQVVVKQFKETAEECCRRLDIDMRDYVNTITPVEPAHENLNKRGFKCPRCHIHVFGTRSVAESFMCHNCKFKFCPYCSTESSLIGSIHQKECFFSLKSIGVSALKKALKEFHVPFEKSLSRKSHKSSVVKGDRKLSEAAAQCKAVDFKRTVSGGGGFIQCVSQVYKGVSVCERHYIEYLLNLINEQQIDVQRSTWARFQNFAAKKGHSLLSVFKQKLDDTKQYQHG